MIISVYVPLFAGLVLAVAAPIFSRWFSPATAVRLSTALALLSAGATTASLTLLAIGGLLKGFSSSHVLTADSVPFQGGALAAIILGVLLARLARTVWRETRTLRELRHAVGEDAGGVVILPDDQAYAYAVPLSGGTVIVSTGMMDNLDVPERAALLAHEQAHLEHAHHRYRLAVAASCALNPLLTGLVRTTRLQTECWADEVAATTTSRGVTARSLAHAALAAVRHPRAAMAYAVDGVLERLSALAGTPRKNRWPAALPAILVVIFGSVALLDAARACWHLIEFTTR
ncbi:MAG: M56 family peptidase [Microbacteriaceae bacterium]|nr:MAG: M56 family peptidase [Microbacteriaceae bacterium]